ncbi:MAG TPA: phosphomannomutase [Verrucomicrobiales bacterium]|nr:phosphomannomutase [Verrucomicrobiales bacterium]
MSNWRQRLAEAVGAGRVLADSGKNIEVLLSGTSDERAEDAVVELVDGGHWAELNDRFYKTLAFGTGGLRGRTIGKVVTRVERGVSEPGHRPEFPCYGTASMNFYNVNRAIRGFISYVKKHLAESGEDRKPVFVIARDTRHFSADFAHYCGTVCVETGCDAYLFDGPRATPELSFALRTLRADAGVVLTASHNPAHDNGFKAYFNDGGQIVEPHAGGIIAEVNALASDSYEALPDDEQGTVHALGVEMDEKYKEKLRTILLRPDLLDGRSARVVYTNLHGTGGWIVVPMLRELGFEVITVKEQDEQDGRFPTVDSPNPENASALHKAIELAEEVGAEAVIGTDPDCDRMGVAVRNAEGGMQLLSGNQIGTLMAWYRIKTFFEQGIVTESNRSRATLIKTFVTTGFQSAVAQHFGIGVVSTLTGFKYIGEKLRKYEEAIPADRRGDYRSLSEEETRALRLEYSRFLVFGGEESYGYLGGDFVRDKDGNGSVVMFAELAAFAMSGEKRITDLLDELYHEYGVYDEMNTDIVLEGAEGAAKIAALTRSYSAQPPTEIDGSAVVKIQDFSRENVYDEEGDLIPRAGMIMVHLEGGQRFAVRPSGTEPKIKFYLFGKGEPEPADLAASKAAVKAGLEALWKWLESDAHSRMEAMGEG